MRRLHGSPDQLRLVVAALVLTGVVAAVGCRPPVQGNGWNVLLVTLETTRADHLGAYGYHRDTSPALDDLAEDGVVFENAISASPRTNPSLATLMTSLYPHDHGVRNLLLPLEPEHRTLAEVLREAGYDTGAVQTHPRLVRGSGFEQGFQDYLDDVPDHPLAEQAVDVAVDWVEDRRGGRRPWFLWLHLMDPHWTYDPPAAWRESFGPEHPLPSEIYRRLRDREITIGPILYRNTMTPGQIQGFVDLYDAEIRYTDHALGRLIGALRAAGDLERTLIVVTADHGESLGENDYYFEHGAFGSDAEIHVPLFVVAPGLIPPGTRSAATVRTLDVAPTVLDVLGLETGTGFRGHTLLSGTGPGGIEREDRGAFGETGKVFHEENRVREVDGLAGKWRWLRKGRFKLVHRPRADGGADRVLYDVETDPGETEDVAGRNPDVVDRMGRELDALLAEDVRPVREYHISEEARDQLRSLGYVN